MYNEIQTAPKSILSSITGIPTIISQNESYDPQLLTPYIRVSVLYAQPSYETMGADGYSSYTGLYQIDVFTPSGTGTTASNDYADDIVNAFIDTNNVIVDTDNSINQIRFIDSWKDNPSQEQDWYKTPVLVRFIVYKNR